MVTFIPFSFLFPRRFSAATSPQRRLQGVTIRPMIESNSFENESIKDFVTVSRLNNSYDRNENYTEVPPISISYGKYGAETIDKDEMPGDAQKETDVFEVPVAKIVVDEEPRSESQEGGKLAAKEDEIKMLKARLYDMEKEHESLGKENESVKNQLGDLASEMSNVKANEDEMVSKVNQIGEELEESRAKTAQ